MCVEDLHKSFSILGPPKPRFHLEQNSSGFFFYSHSAVGKCLLYQPLRNIIRLNVVHRGPAKPADTAQLPLHSSVLPHLCLQVQQRAQECIKALNLILKISSGEEVMNVLNSDFDWSHLKVSEGSWLPSVERPVTLLVSLCHFRTASCKLF